MDAAGAVVVVVPAAVAIAALSIIGYQLKKKRAANSGKRTG